MERSHNTGLEKVQDYSICVELDSDLILSGMSFSVKCLFFFFL